MSFSLFYPKEFAPNPFFRAPALAHHVPIATVRDDLYVLTDYTLVSVYRVRGLQYELASNEQLVAWVNGLRTVLNSLRPGIQLKVLYRITHNYRTLLEEHADHLTSNNVFARYVAWELINYYYNMMRNRELLRTEVLIALAYKPDVPWWKDALAFKNVVKNVKSLKNPGKTREAYGIMLNKYESMIRPVVQQMGLVGLDPARLNNDELYELAWSILNPNESLKRPCPKIQVPWSRDPYINAVAELSDAGAVKKHPDIAFIAPPSEREQLCHSDWIVRKGHVEIDGLYYGAITLRMLPTHVYPGMALNLATLPFEATVSIDCQMLKKQKEIEKLWSQKRREEAFAQEGFMGTAPNPLEMARAQEKEERLYELSSGDQNYFRFRVAIVVAATSPDELDSRIDHVLTVLRNMDNAVGKREIYGVEDVIKITWPFFPITNMYTRKALTSEASYFLPIFERWKGAPKATTLCLDRANHLIRHDPHPSHIPNKNKVISGGSGRGKSVAAQLIDIQPHAACKDTEILLLESGASFALTTETFGGLNIALGPKTDYRFNPLDLPPNYDSLPPGKQQEELTYKLSFVKNFILCLANIRDPLMEQVAENVIGKVAQDTYMAVRNPKLRDFYRMLGRYQNPDDPEAERFAGRLRTLLLNYVTDENGREGIYAKYFDVDTNFDVEAPMICFDLTDIKGDEALLNPMMLSVIGSLFYNRIKRGDKRRLLIIDEAWALLTADDYGQLSPAAKGIETFFREGRKLDASSVLISQNYSDLVSNVIGKAISGNTEIKYFLANKRNAENNDALAQAGYTNEQIETIYRLQTAIGSYSELMLDVSGDIGVVRIPSTPLRYWLSTTNPDDKRIRQRYIDVYHKGYNLPLHVTLAILAHDYPSGAQGVHNEMTEEEALVFADQFQEHYERFAALVNEGKPIPFDFK